MKKKLRNVALAAALGVGLVGTTAFTSQASASSLETTVVEFEETSVVNGDSEAQPRNLTFIKAATKVGKLIFGTGKANNRDVSVLEDADVIFDK